MDAKGAVGNATNHQMNRQVSNMESIYEAMPVNGRRRRRFLPDASHRWWANSPLKMHIAFQLSKRN